LLGYAGDPPEILPEHEMDAVADERRWYREIERRLAARFRGVYLSFGFAALMGFGFANTQRMMHDGALLPVTATVVALGTDSSGEPTMTSSFVDAEGNWHRDTQPASYHYARGEPRVGDSIPYLYGIHSATGMFYSVPRADGILKWFFGVPAAVFTLVGIVLVVLILRERSARRELVRVGLRVPLEMPRIGHRAMTLPGGAAGAVHFELWRLEGRVFDAARGEFVECASDWQQPPPPELGAAPLPPLLVDRRHPGRSWLPVGELDYAGHAARRQAA
jgi:hypothetical protein